jgi:hypothetical protein
MSKIQKSKIELESKIFNFFIRKHIKYINRVLFVIIQRVTIGIDNFNIYVYALRFFPDFPVFFVTICNHFVTIL